MGFFATLKAIEKKIDRFVWGKNPQKLRRSLPRGVKSRAKEWNVFLYIDGRIVKAGTVRAGQWTTAMTKARQIAKGKNADRIQVKLKRDGK